MGWEIALCNRDRVYEAEYDHVHTHGINEVPRGNSASTTVANGPKRTRSSEIRLGHLSLYSRTIRSLHLSCNIARGVGLI